MSINLRLMFCCLMFTSTGYGLGLEHVCRTSITSIGMELDNYEKEGRYYKEDFNFHVGYPIGKKKICEMILDGLESSSEPSESVDEEDIAEFYLEPRVEHNGHLWRPILMKHHPECPCQNPTLI